MNFARIILFAIFICCALSAQAQLSANQGIGAFSFGGGGELLSPQAQKIQDETVRKNANTRILNGHVFRRINGQIVNFYENGETIYGQMDTVSDGITILVESNGRYTRFALTNYQNSVINGQEVNVCAIRIGIYKEGDAPLALWDCGTPLTDEEEKEHIDQIRAEQAAQRKILDDAARQRNFLIQSNAIVSLLPHATNGETWAQTGVAIRYLNGQGCETNKNLAIFWLQKAAAQGDSEASNYLARINSISTNAIPAKAP